MLEIINLSWSLHETFVSMSIVSPKICESISAENAEKGHLPPLGKLQRGVGRHPNVAIDKCEGDSQRC